MIYAIVGPTGVGKTKLSIMLAKKLNAEIINCDSQQVYKELSIGVAKIKEEEKEGIIHHLIDNVSVLDNYSVYEYQNDARMVLNRLLSEGKNVVIVGGTGLYLKALLYDYTFDDSGNKDKKLYDFKLIGLTRDRTHLYEIINDRVDLMIDSGLEDEVRVLYDKGTFSKVVNTAIGYKEFCSYFRGEITKDEAISLIKKRSRNYAKRQYTFFNNQFNDICWYDVDMISLDDIVNTVI